MSLENVIVPDEYPTKPPQDVDQWLQLSRWSRSPQGRAAITGMIVASAATVAGIGWIVYLLLQIVSQLGEILHYVKGF